MALGELALPRLQRRALDRRRQAQRGVAAMLDANVVSSIAGRAASTYSRPVQAVERLIKR